MKWRRFFSAFTRYRRSKGFGIHSPFAFKFVLNVLREHHAYYAYSDIAVLREKAKKVSHLQPLSQKEAQLLFRIANYFNPEEVMQVGNSGGIAGASMLAVANKMQIHTCDTSQWLSAFGHKVNVHDDFPTCQAQYSSTTTGGVQPFILVEAIPEGQTDALRAYLSEILCHDAVVILRNIDLDNAMHSLWMECRDAASTGMTFSNHKLAVLVASPKLQHQHFSLWL